MKDTEQERKDWYLLLLFLPPAILLMFFAGQKAIQLLPRWNLNADIGSNLDPNRDQSGSVTGPLAPLRPEILTPPSWNDTFLTPSADQSSATQPTFVAFNPSATSSASPTPQPTGTTQATTTSTVTTTVTVTTKATKTKKPRNPPPTPVPVTSTIDPSLAQLSPVPSGYNEGPSDGSFATIPDGSYVVVTLSTPVAVTGPSDTAPDMVYYERTTNPTQIAMDSVVLGLSQDSSGNPYYAVFNWGDGTPDTNTNVDTTTLSPPPNPTSPPEADNALISTSSLYPSPSGTGITIDVDNAASHPPAGDYPYIVIIAPVSPPNDGNDGAEVDAVQALP